MSIVNKTNIKDIMGRIEVATKNSPVVVFQHTTIRDDGTQEPDFDIVFSNTVVTTARIKYNPVGLVGSFFNDNKECLENIRSFFKNYENNPVWGGM